MVLHLSAGVVCLIMIAATGTVSGEYLGCFEDAGNRLLSDYRMELSEINNPSRCTYICERLGYQYAGVEFGSHCFCSSQRPSVEKRRNENDCKSSCPNSQEKCGGSWRISVYSVNSTEQPTQKPPKTVTDKAVKVSGGYHGCYEDSGSRALSDYQVDLSSINSPSKCVYICTRMGYRYALLENGIQCLCSYQKPSDSMKRSEDECQSPCPNSNYKCGGPLRLAVYSVELYGAATTPAGIKHTPVVVSDRRETYMGCFEDAGNRLLADFRIEFSEINSPRKCVHVCRALGLPYAGVEYGSQCYCSKQRPGEDKRKSENDCRASCPHSTEKCGGTWRIAVYNYTLDPASQTDISDEAMAQTHLGCFEDNGKRLLSDYRITLDEINTPKKCLHVCRQLGYKYAGVENGNQCFCGNQKPGDDKKKSNSECKSLCPKSQEKCGGFWRLSVHQAEDSPTLDVRSES